MDLWSLRPFKTVHMIYSFIWSSTFEGDTGYVVLLSIITRQVTLGLKHNWLYLRYLKLKWQANFFFKETRIKLGLSTKDFDLHDKSSFVM